MNYELLYIIPATIADDELGKVEGEVKALLEKNGAKITESARLGKLRFAYPINNTRYGHYVLTHFDAEGESLAKIDAALRIVNTVLRRLIIRLDGAVTPFNLVQYAEVVVESKSDSKRRKRATDEKKEATSREDITSGVKAIEGEGANEAKKDADAAPFTDTELDKKLSEVLIKDTNEA